METRKYCAYNKTRETFLSFSFTVIDAALEPLRVLKLLIEGLPRGAATGIWLTHFKDVPVAQALSPFDLVYLDKDYRVVHGVELTTEGAFAPFKGEPASALVLPPRSLSGSKTAHGDQLLIRFAEEAQSQGERAALPTASDRIPDHSAAEAAAGAHFASTTFPPPTSSDVLAKNRLERFMGPRPPQPTSSEPRVQSARSLIELSPAASRPAQQPAASQGPLGSRPRIQPPVRKELQLPLQEASPIPLAEPAAPTEPAPPPPAPAPSTVISQAAVDQSQSSPTETQARPPDQIPIKPSAVPAPSHPPDRSQAPGPQRLVYPIEPLVVPDAAGSIPEQAAPQRSHPRIESPENPPLATPPVPESPAASASPAWAPSHSPSVVAAPQPEESEPGVPQSAPTPDQPAPSAPPTPEALPPPAIARPRPPQHAQGPESLKLRILHWLFPDLAIQEKAYPKHDRRRAHRIPVPDLVAYYWTGGAPRPRKIGNLSVTGFYLQTEERWMPGTIIRMTLQLVGSTGEHRHDTVTVHSRLVRWGPDGEAFEFVLAGFDRLSKRH